MQNNTYTIIIKDKTSGSTNKTSLTSKDVSSDGSVKQKFKNTGTRKSKGRPRVKTSVEHNRFSRAWNSTFNKVTNGFWEKANRAGNAARGAMLGSAVGWTILAQFAINYAFDEWSNFKRTQQERNEKDALKIRVGALDLGTGDSYSLNRNFWTGRIHYKTNR